MTFRTALATATLGLLLCLGQAQAAPQVNGHQVSVQADDVRHYLDGHFPQHHDALGGLVSLTVSHPELTLPPGDRLHLAFDLALATAGGSPAPLGRVALSSALRYDTQRQGFFLDQPSLEDFQPAHEGARLDANTRHLLDGWLADYARKQPIYRIDPAVAQLLGTLQVESAAVQDGRLVVNFNQDVGSLVPPGLLR